MVRAIGDLPRSTRRVDHKKRPPDVRRPLGVSFSTDAKSAFVRGCVVVGRSGVGFFIASRFLNHRFFNRFRAIGILFLVLGGLGIGLWEGYDYLWAVLRGSVPLLFVLFGLAAIAVGISSIKDKAASSQEEEKKE